MQEVKDAVLQVDPVAEVYFSVQGLEEIFIRNRIGIYWCAAGEVFGCK